MAKYLSIDTEATGLEESTHLIQLAFVPVDIEKKIVRQTLAKEILVRCPSFEELKPKLSPWVLEHNEALIRHAHANGIPAKELPGIVANYLASAEMAPLFEEERPVLLGKSLSALDIPLLTRYLGREFFQKHFHHHTVDITSISRYLVDAGQLPQGCESTTNILKFFHIRENSKHTALSDALDMAQIYIRLVEIMEKPRKSP
jgi:DNA polymerase-3 subunit epsilon